MCIKNIEKFFDVEKNIFNIVEGMYFPGLTNPSINTKLSSLLSFFLFLETTILSTFHQI
jgi:hypothetical protein